MSAWDFIGVGAVAALLAVAAAAVWAWRQFQRDWVTGR